MAWGIAKAKQVGAPPFMNLYVMASRPFFVVCKKTYCQKAGEGQGNLRLPDEGESRDVKSILT